MRNQIKPWMQKLATIHAMNEAATKNLDAKAILESWGNMHMNPDANFAGMGDPTLPNGTLNPDGSFTGDPAKGFVGSGDMPSSTLPMAMAIAAQAIALELLPTVPISTALTILPYVNGVYAGGATNRRMGTLDYSAKNPRLLKGYIKNWDTKTAAEKQAILTTLKEHAAEIVVGGTSTIGAKVSFTGMLSFYDKAPIFEVVYSNEAYRNGNIGGSSVQEGATFDNLVNAIGTAAVVTLTYGDPDPEEGDPDPDAFELTIEKFDTVKTYEDFVPFFTGVSKYSGDRNSLYGTKNSSAVAAPYDLATLNPYLRSEGEVTPANKVSLEMASTKVDAKTIKILGEITREQFQDMTAYGYDPYGFINAILTNECTQRINFDVLKAIHQLGSKHAESINFNANVVVGGDLHENTLSIQKQVVAKFNLASNIISTRSRVSPADWVVVGAGIGAAIMDMPTFLASPVSQFANATGNNAIYCIGNLGRLKVYVDPYLDYDSTLCVVGAIGTEQSPGLKFMPYILADQITYPSEGMGGQNVVSMTSRYAIAPAGMHPESMYLSFNIKIKRDNSTSTDLSQIFPYLG